MLVGHGTRDPEGTAEFFQLASVLARRMVPVPVEGCLLEFQHPTIPEAWQTLVRRGAKRICVAPLLLFAAGHARSDIPDAVAACAAETPGVMSVQSGPLSRAPTIVELLACRIQEATPQADDSVGLLMVGRGSYDPCAKADMRVLGEIVARRCGIGQHAVGFYAMAEPKVPETLDELAARPGIQTVIVQPHLLFQGRLYDAIGTQVREASQRHPDVRFVVGDYLGPTPEVAEALMRRIGQATW
ncbi:sirohydrochlorin chelatase [Rhodopirellula sp. JC639]|uniref:sirohydrochlorin chelatase n=1 Tax=Stieleria mannarensis TaxID=2755585 RepID=UPI00257001A4|nr:sirohydrochlorin chelatase [Rhodopirellula sp. JC639]